MTKEEDKNLVKRYLLEQGYNNGYIKKLEMSDVAYQNAMYQKFEAKEIVIDQKIFENWLENYRKNNFQFVELLKAAQMKMGQSIIELSETTKNSITGLKEFPFTKSTIILTNPSNNDDLEVNSLKNLDNTNLLCNGVYYKKMADLSSKTLKLFGSFAIGYCGISNLEYTRYMLEYYKKAREDLLSMFGDKLGEVALKIGDREVKILVKEQVEDKQREIFERNISQR